MPDDEHGAVEFEPVLKIAADHGYEGRLAIEAKQDAAIRDPLTYQSVGLNALKAIAKTAGLDKDQGNA